MHISAEAANGRRPQIRSCGDSAGGYGGACDVQIDVVQSMSIVNSSMLPIADGDVIGQVGIFGGQAAFERARRTCLWPPPFSATWHCAHFVLKIFSPFATSPAGASANDAMTKYFAGERCGVLYNVRWQGSITQSLIASCRPNCMVHRQRVGDVVTHGFAGNALTPSHS